MGACARHAYEIIGLSREGGASYDRPAPQDDQWELDILEDEDGTGSGGLAHDQILCART